MRSTRRCVGAWRCGKGVASSAPATMSPRTCTSPSSITVCTRAPSLLASTAAPDRALVARTVATTTSPSERERPSMAAAVSLPTATKPPDSEPTSASPAMPNATSYVTYGSTSPTKPNHDAAAVSSSATTSTSTTRSPSSTVPTTGGVRSTTLPTPRASAVVPPVASSTTRTATWNRVPCWNGRLSTAALNCASSASASSAWRHRDAPAPRPTDTCVVDGAAVAASGTTHATPRTASAPCAAQHSWHSSTLSPGADLICVPLHRMHSPLRRYVPTGQTHSAGSPHSTPRTASGCVGVGPHSGGCVSSSSGGTGASASAGQPVPTPPASAAHSEAALP
mmetsp:Transcript_26958/g.93574  ORF Transcript_26958/g.93574 Transcript_26958/m.93574 type:complete len:337 (+) Transcript_26958:760-1770(+)